MEEKLKECTFTPNGNKIRANSAKVSNRLYHNSSSRKELKLEEVKKSIERDRYKKIDKECTFEPNLYKVNSKMFSNNPLKDDKYIEANSKRYEEARMERKISKYKLETGNITTKRL